jgi:DNA polymerase III delta subunit
VNNKEDIEKLKFNLFGALIPNPEILFIRMSPKLINQFPLEINSNEKIIVLYGLEKVISQKTNAFVIRLYNLKEPYKSRAIQKLLEQQNLKLSLKAINWLSLSHQNFEALIPKTIEKIKLTHQKHEISDTEVRPLIYNYNHFQAYEILDQLSSKTTLQLFISSQRAEDWPGIYWMILTSWRKFILCKEDKSLLSTYFPWDSQKKQALFFLTQLSLKTFSLQLEALLDLEKDIKGLRKEPFVEKLKHWLLKTHQQLSN